MQISGLPSEMIIEIIKFSSAGIHLLSNLSLVCKEWNNLIKSEEFCKFIYHSFFGWRNNLLNNNTDQKTIINYHLLLQNELKFWNSWNFYSQPNEFQLSNNFNNVKQQRLLRIKRLHILDKRNLITQPLFYNTGAYYFEIKCLQWRNQGDNVFIGFIFQPSNKNFNNINFSTYIGSGNKGSFGLYFPDGDIYGVISQASMRYMNQKINVNIKVGVYLDTDNLLVRFVLVKEKKCFPMLSLEKFLNEEEMASFKKKELVLYPAISILYADGELELNATAGFKSIKKAQWIKEVVSQQQLKENENVTENVNYNEDLENF